MAQEIRARFSKGKLEPLDSLILEDGDEVVISIKQVRSSFMDSDWKRQLEKAAAKAGFTTEEQINELIYAKRHGTN